MILQAWDPLRPAAHQLVLGAWGFVCALAISVPALAQGVGAEQTCADALPGKVAWSLQGDKGWDAVTARRLCQGTTNPGATVACFQNEIQNHNDWARGIAACQAGPASPAATATTGRNVTAVTYGRADSATIQFRLMEPGKWFEYSKGGKEVMRWAETRRDDGSVYLINRASNFKMQFDLHTRKVLVGEGNDPLIARYSIVDVSSAVAAAPPPAAVAMPSPPPQQEAAAEPPNGRNLTWIAYGQLGTREVVGHVRRKGPREWEEVDGSGKALFRFEEVQRDDWSVYLVDRSRGVNLQLDVHTNKVMYSEGNGPRRELYQILRKGRY